MRDRGREKEEKAEDKAYPESDTPSICVTGKALDRKLHFEDDEFWQAGLMVRRSFPERLWVESHVSLLLFFFSFYISISMNI